MLSPFPFGRERQAALALCDNIAQWLTTQNSLSAKRAAFGVTLTDCLSIAPVVINKKAVQSGKQNAS